MHFCHLNTHPPTPKQVVWLIWIFSTECSRHRCKWKPLMDAACNSNLILALSTSRTYVSQSFWPQPVVILTAIVYYTSVMLADCRYSSRYTSAILAVAQSLLWPLQCNYVCILTITIKRFQWIHFGCTQRIQYC